jgi:hypothetical protein
MMVAMTSPLYSDSDREILDTIRLHLFACYTNADDGREYTSEELEEVFARDTGLRAWVTDVAGINPDTLVAETHTGQAMINVCVNAWVARIGGLSSDDTFNLIMAGLRQLLQ